MPAEGLPRSPAAPPRAAHPLSAKERLLDAAAELLTQQPPSAVSTREIARLAGVQQSLIFRHFGSKEQLVREVAAGYAVAYRDAVQAAGDDPLMGFHRAVDFMLSTKGRAALFALTLIDEEAEETWSASRPGIEAHVTQIQQASPDRGATERRRNPWLVSAFAQALIAGWSFLETWAMAGGGLADLDVEQARHQLHEVVEDLVRREAGLPRSSPHPGHTPP
jgi:AcrR family transcriptional regulator